MRNPKTKHIAEILYLGGRLRLSVTDRGFTLKELQEDVWVIDASTLNDNENKYDGICITDKVKKFRKAKAEPNHLFAPLVNPPPFGLNE